MSLHMNQSPHTTIINRSITYHRTACKSEQFGARTKCLTWSNIHTNAKEKERSKLRKQDNTLTSSITTGRSSSIPRHENKYTNSTLYMKHSMQVNFTNASQFYECKYKASTRQTLNIYVQWSYWSYIGGFLSQAPTSSYKRVLYILHKGFWRAQLPDWRSKIAQKCALLLRIYTSNPHVEHMTGPNTATDVRHGVGIFKFELLDGIRDNAIVISTFASLRCLISKLRLYFTLWIR